MHTSATHFFLLFSASAFAAFTTFTLFLISRPIKNYNHLFLTPFPKNDPERDNGSLPGPPICDDPQLFIRAVSASRSCFTKRVCNFTFLHPHFPIDTTLVFNKQPSTGSSVTTLLTYQQEPSSIAPL